MFARFVFCVLKLHNETVVMVSFYSFSFDGNFLSLGNDTSEILVVLKLTISHFHHHRVTEMRRWGEENISRKTFSLKSCSIFVDDWRRGYRFWCAVCHI